MIKSSTSVWSSMAVKWSENVYVVPSRRENVMESNKKKKTPHGPVDDRVCLCSCLGMCMPLPAYLLMCAGLHDCKTHFNLLIHFTWCACTACAIRSCASVREGGGDKKKLKCCHRCLILFIHGYWCVPDKTRASVRHLQTNSPTQGSQDESLTQPEPR